MPVIRRVRNGQRDEVFTAKFQWNGKTVWCHLATTDRAEAERLERAIKKELGWVPTGHGMSRGHRVYGVWKTMIQRCHNQKHRAYRYYGARGIQVCLRWRRDFRAFWQDMGAGYKPGLTLDRVDNDRGYCPENCRWTTWRLQALNKRKGKRPDGANCSDQSWHPIDPLLQQLLAQRAREQSQRRSRR
jgi:hypothetical protein